jgi:hypothetical protein
LLAALSGKLGFIWWQATGDGFDVIENSLLPFRQWLVNANDSALLELANEVKDKGLENTVVNLYKGRNYISIRWNAMRDISDKFDRALLVKKDALDNWRNVNILYRQIMKSNNSRQLNQDTEGNKKFWI